MKIKNYHDFLNPAEELTLKIVAAGDAVFCEEWNASETTPPYSRLYFTGRGEGEIVCKDEHFPLRRGVLCLIPSGLSLTRHCVKEMRQIYFHIDLISGRGSDLLRGLNAPLLKNISDEVFNEVIRLHSSSDPTERMRLRSLLQMVIFEILTENGVRLSSVEYSGCVLDAIAFIKNNLSATLSIKDVSRAVFVSADTLSRKFKEEMGVSVGRYINGMLMMKAEDMLLSSKLNIAQIGRSLGFGDQFYFSRRFKEYFAVSPTQFRKQHER